MYNTKNEYGFNQRMYTHLSQTENAFSVDRELDMRIQHYTYTWYKMLACMGVSVVDHWMNNSQ